MEYRCVHCGFRVKTLLVQYSLGNIRLMKCENCKAVADEYIECELMIVLIDLILHKPKVYKHILYNALNLQITHFQCQLWKSLFGFLVLDAYQSLLFKRPDDEWGMSMRVSSFSWICRKILVDVILGNFMFLCSFLLAMRNLLKTSARCTRSRDLLLAVLISSYFKIFLAAMMVMLLSRLTRLISYLEKTYCWLLHLLFDLFSSIYILVIKYHPSDSSFAFYRSGNFHFQ